MTLILISKDSPGVYSTLVALTVSAVLLNCSISNYLVDPGPLDKRTPSQIVPKITICTK